MRLAGRRQMPLVVAGVLLLMSASTLSGGRRLAADELPLLLKEDFQGGADRWEPTDKSAWRIEKQGEQAIYSQFKKRSNYEPPHRSPYNMSLLRDIEVGSFTLTARVKSTHPDYGHRDVCLFFGYQDPAHFYYVHLGKKTDDHANQIFIVDGKPRTKISTRTTPGTPWDDQWHTVRIERDADKGTIAVYYDDMQTPVMTATNLRFVRGRIGLGSFDDTSAWNHVELRGLRLTPKTNKSANKSAN